MGKSKKPAINVAQAIRDIVSKDPKAKPAEIVELLRKRYKVTVTKQYASTTKSNARKKTAKISPEYEYLVAAREFVKKMGGVEKALRILNDYRELFGEDI